MGRAIVRGGRELVIGISHFIIAMLGAACKSALSPFLHLSFPPPLVSSIMPRWNRSMVLVTSLLGAVLNSVLAIQLVALWRTLKKDSESEWEGSLDPWTVNTLSLLGGLSAAYFVTAAVACSIGFAGIIKVRLQLLSRLSHAPSGRQLSVVLLRFIGRTGVPSLLSRFLRRRLRVLHHFHCLCDICLL